MFIILFALNSERDNSGKINIGDLLLRRTNLKFNCTTVSGFCYEGNFIFTFCGVCKFYLDIFKVEVKVYSHIESRKIKIKCSILAAAVVIIIITSSSSSGW